MNVAQHEINLVFQLFYAKGSGLNWRTLCHVNFFTTSWSSIHATLRQKLIGQPIRVEPKLNLTCTQAFSISWRRFMCSHHKLSLVNLIFSGHFYPTTNIQITNSIDNIPWSASHSFIQAIYLRQGCRDNWVPKASVVTILLIESTLLSQPVTQSALFSTGYNWTGPSY